MQGMERRPRVSTGSMLTWGLGSYYDLLKKVPARPGKAASGGGQWGQAVTSPPPPPAASCCGADGCFQEVSSGDKYQ